VALRFERRHLPFRTWYHKRGLGGGGALRCCLELMQGGVLDLMQGGCLELMSCSVRSCCFLLEDDPGDGSLVILLEDDTDGSACLQPEDCP
jgi:hypothetical protein